MDARRANPSYDAESSRAATLVAMRNDCVCIDSLRKFSFTAANQDFKQHRSSVFNLRMLTRFAIDMQLAFDFLRAASANVFRSTMDKGIRKQFVHRFLPAFLDQGQMDRPH